MFTTNGEVHHGGIQNELDVIDVLNKANVYATPVVHAGGTQNKADAVAGDIGISIKRKKNLKNGSYDYLNSTIPVASLPDIEYLNELVQGIPAMEQTEVNKTVAKHAFNASSSFVLDGLDSDTLTDIVSHTFEAQSGMDIAITDQSTDTLYLFSADEMEVPRLLDEGYKATIVKTNNVSTSRKVVFVKDGDIVDTGLRIRLVLNNGVGALMGMSKANKTSSVVVKIQQDKVSKMVSNTPHKVLAMTEGK